MSDPEDDRLRARFRRLRYREPSERAHARVRARILDDLGAVGRRRRLVPPALAVLGAALALGSLLAFRAVTRAPFPPSAVGPQAGASRAAEGRGEAASSIPSPAPVAPSLGPEPFAGVVTDLGGARFTQRREGGAERVRLEDGDLRIQVRHQRTGESFVVELPDGELEVRGTVFEILVRERRTTKVRVDEGLVALRIHGAEPVLLRPPQSWSPPAAVASLPMPAPRPREPEEAGYLEAMSLFRAGRFGDAAVAFHAFVLSHPRSPAAEDASFLEASALARQGDVAGAAAAAERHADAYPRSFHRKDAAILVARGARDRGDCERAREALAAWLGPPPDVDAQATLRGCLPDR